MQNNGTQSRNHVIISVCVCVNHVIISVCVCVNYRLLVGVKFKFLKLSR